MKILNIKEILRCEKCGEIYNEIEKYDFIICPACKYIKKIKDENFL